MQLLPLRRFAITCLTLCLLTAGAEGENPESPADQVRWATGADGMLYEAVISVSAVKHAAGEGERGSVAEPRRQPVGLLKAAELGSDAFSRLMGEREKEWVLHVAERCEIHGTWVYRAAFVKREERVPRSPAAQLSIIVLCDGTVVPTKVRENR